MIISSNIVRLFSGEPYYVIPNVLYESSRVSVWAFDRWEKFEELSSSEGLLFMKVRSIPGRTIVDRIN